MSSNYNLNQKGAVVTVVFDAIRALSSLTIAVDMGLQSTYALAIFGVMTLLAWILIPLYTKRIKPGFVLGIILLVLGLVGLFASLGVPPWYTFTNPISIVKEPSFVIHVLAGLYFSYRSYKEL